MGEVKQLFGGRHVYRRDSTGDGNALSFQCTYDIDSRDNEKSGNDVIAKCGTIANRW